MNGKNFRDWVVEMNDVVDDWRNFRLEGEPNHPDYVAPTNDDK
jgi:hypothetical protein